MSCHVSKKLCAYLLRLPGFLNVVCSYNDGGASPLNDLQQVLPDPGKRSNIYNISGSQSFFRKENKTFIRPNFVRGDIKIQR